MDQVFYLFPLEGQVKELGLLKYHLVHEVLFQFQVHILEVAKFLEASRSSRWVGRVFYLILFKGQVEESGLWQ